MKTYKEDLEQASRNLPALLERAHHGKITVITKCGMPYAAIIPVGETMKRTAGIRIQDLRGSGKGLWGGDVPAWASRIQSEWE